MLHRLKLSQKIAAAKDSLLLQKNKNKEEVLLAQWAKIIVADDFKEQVYEAESSFLLPTWTEPLHLKYEVKKNEQPYFVLGVDGSQIYPDRHQRHIPYALINLGGIGIAYEHQSSVTLFSEPELLPLYIKDTNNEIVTVTSQWVDYFRQARELEKGVEQALEVKRTTSQTPFLLFDGTLIFWQLESCNEADKAFFLEKYMNALKQLFEAQIPYASYISLPQSKELINLIKLSLCRFRRANCIPCHAAYDTFPCELADTLTDVSLLARWLGKNERTIFFKSNSHIIKKYPKELAPYFAYFSSSFEVGRIEFPAWLTHQTELCDQLFSVIADQIEKGNGYPVVLAEAHEQAVIKNDDKQFFYELLSRDAVKEDTALEYSIKSLKKKRMPI